MLINGRMYDWASVELGIAGMPIPSFTSIEYEDSQDLKKVYGKGRKPVGYAKGNYDCSGKVTMHREAFEELQTVVPLIAAQLGRSGVTSLYDLPPIPVTVSYANPDKPIVKDTLKNVQFKSRKSSMSQGDDAATVEMDMFLDEVAWNGKTMKD